MTLFSDDWDSYFPVIRQFLLKKLCKDREAADGILLAKNSAHSSTATRRVNILSVRITI